MDTRQAQFYTRMIPGEFTNVHPVGRPDLVLSVEELNACIILKFGYHGGHTGRQNSHDYTYKNSKLLDSFITSSSAVVEQRCKDQGYHKGFLYEGTYENKAVRDTELLLVKTQEGYDELMKVVQYVIGDVESPLLFKIASEHTKKAEAEARKAEADADARKAEAQAQVRLAEIQLEMQRLKRIDIHN